MPTVRRNTPMMIIQIIGLAGVWFLGVYLERNGFGIEGAAWARVLAMALVSLATLLYSDFLTSRNIEARI